MKRSGAQKKPKIRRKKRKSWQLGAPASYVPATLMALLATLSYTSAWWWLGSVVREVGVWFAVVASLVAALHGGMRQWDRSLLSALSAGAFIGPFAPFFLSDRQTPSHGPTLDIRHVHVGSYAPDAAKLRVLSRTAGAQLLSFTFDNAAAAQAMPRPTDGYRRVHSAGTGDRVLWLRGVSNGHGASTVRVGGCSLAIEQISLPSVFNIGSRSSRRNQLAGLPDRPSHQPSVLVGHLGSSPRAFDVTSLVTAQELRDARPRRALLGTYPALFGPLGLPLDSPLVHGWVAVRLLEPFDAGFATPYRGVHAIVELTEPRCARPVRRGM